MRWREDTVLANGVRLFVRRVVEPAAPAVLLLHGLGVGGSIWQSFARRLLPHLAAVAPDMRGHGQSEAPAAGYAPTDYARDLIALTDAESSSPSQVVSHSPGALGAPVPVDGDSAAALVRPVPVVGHSLGALVALAMAEVRPDLISWLVLLDPPLDPDIQNSEVQSVYELRHAPAGALEAYLLSRHPGGGELLARSLAKLFRQASDAAFEGMLDPAHADGRQLSSKASGIQAPVLVLQADPARGGILGDSAAKSFVASLPKGKLQKITAAPHALHASHPAEVARAILDFGGYSSDGSSDSV